MSLTCVSCKDEEWLPDPHEFPLESGDIMLTVTGPPVILCAQSTTSPLSTLKMGSCVIPIIVSFILSPTRA